MKLSFLLDSAEGAGCLCRMTAQDGTATLSLTPPVYDGRPHDTAALEGCYETALDAALSSGCGSVTIPTLGAWGGCRPNLPFRWRWWQWSGGARLTPTRRWT